MDEQQTSVEEVYRSNRKDCSRYRLVLEAAGIPYQVRQDSGESVIVVPASVAAEARTEIDAYTRENQPSPSGKPTVLEQGSGRVGVVGYVVVLVLVFWFQNQGILSEQWVDAGKTHAGLICQGEWWRTVTALSLHSDFRHLFANIGFGGLFGLFVGQMLGSGLAWISILAAGAVGNLVNAWVRNPGHTSVGASTAVFAALGIVAALAAIHRRPARSSKFARYTPIIGAFILVGYVGTSGERTDVLAHVAGFVSGLLVGALHAKLGHRIKMGTRSQILFGIGTVGFLGLSWLIALTHHNP